MFFQGTSKEPLNVYSSVVLLGPKTARAFLVVLKFKLSSDPRPSTSPLTASLCSEVQPRG